MNGCCGLPGLFREGPLQSPRLRGLLGSGALLIALFVTPPYAIAELADVHLKAGLVLRGDVTQTATEVILKNAAGELRIPLVEVSHVVVVGPAADVAEDAGERDRPRRGRNGALVPAPPISDRDIHRLKLAELSVDGVPEVVRVRFKKKGRERDLDEEVLDLLRQRESFQVEWADILTRGRPFEKLQLIVRETGMQYADRIEILSDPEAFERYRQQVLPLVEKSCARSSCHGGKEAKLFRFPVGSSRSDAYAYTSYVMLDQMQTPNGPIINRISPQESVLLGYMLPREGNPMAHPEPREGPVFKPVLRGPDDPDYTAVLDWINFLMVPRPEYGLEYENPYAGMIAAPRPEKPDDAANPAD